MGAEDLWALTLVSCHHKTPAAAITVSGSTTTHKSKITASAVKFLPDSPDWALLLATDGPDASLG